MTSMTDLVRESLTELTGAAAMPPGLGGRAIAAGRRRRRRRATLVGVAAVVAAAAMVLPFAVFGGRDAPSPATATAENVIFAVRNTEYLAQSDRESDVHRWEVLDPVTGDYRDVMVKEVSEPTLDLRYAAVLPKGDGAQVPRTIGRYETTTGKLRWYPVPIQPDFVTISPDGRYAAARGWSDTAQAADIAVVDLETDEVRRFDTAHLYESAAAPPSAPGQEPAVPPLAIAMFDERTPQIQWAADSRHLIFGAGVTDLDGRLTGEVARPRQSGVVSVHRGGAGTLVRTGFATTDYAVVDGHGAVRYGTPSGDWTCEGTRQDAMSRCGKPWAVFLSWRGSEQILVQTGPDPYASSGNAPATPAGEAPGEATYEVLDLRTGHRQAISVPPFGGDARDDIAHSFAVVISADSLSPAVRDRRAF